MQDSPETTKRALLDAALPNVAFDGWSPVTFRAAARAVDVDYDAARALFPRGSVDLALYFHATADDAMAARLAETDMTRLKFREKVATAIRIRLEVIEDKEAVRRAVTLFALPHHAGDSARAVWQTADRIWTELGDTSKDLNWYSKRATLSGVWASSVLYWLGDDSLGHADTWAFVDRRIDDVMRIEKVKAQVGKVPGLGALKRIQDTVMARVRPATPDFNRPGFPPDAGRSAP